MCLAVTSKSETEAASEPAHADDELERATLEWLMGGFPWAHGRTIIKTRAAEWVQQGGDSREVSATDLQHCNWCGTGLLTMLKCGKCRLVYYCSIDCQKGRKEQAQSGLLAQAQHGRRDGA